MNDISKFGPVTFITFITFIIMVSILWLFCYNVGETRLFINNVMLST